MRHTFLNDNSEGTMRQEGLRHLESRVEDFIFYMMFTDHTDSESQFIDDVKDQDFDNVEHMVKTLLKFSDLPPFNEYGLGFDYVELGTFDDQNEDYFRFQLSYGGPSEEIRFYEDGTIVFVYLNWFAGVGFNVSGEDWATWLEDMFKSIDMLNFETEREKYDYWDQVYAAEEEE